MDAVPDLSLVFLTLVCSFFFSGMEIAFVSVNKLQVELDKKQGAFSARLLSGFLDRPSRFIGTLLLGNNIALVIYGITMAKLLEPVIGRFISSNEMVVLMVQTLISTLIILVIAEFLPKTIFRVDPNRVLAVCAIPLKLIYWLLYPAMIFTIGLANLILRWLKVDMAEEKVAFGRVDLDHYVDEIVEQARKKDVDVENEIQIFQNALDLSGVKVRECMVPRTEIVAMDINTPIEAIKERFIETGLSKILIFRGSMDNIIGYTRSFELFKRPQTVKNMMLPLLIVPETMPANEVLEMFIKKQRNIAVVVDEFGGTSGMLTIEDVVEEIFGEIEDEHDKETEIETQISENEFEFSARLEVDYLVEKYDLPLPQSDQYETLAGLIIHVAESIPKEGEVLEHDRLRFTISKVSENRIDVVRLFIISPQEGS